MNSINLFAVEELLLVLQKLVVIGGSQENSLHIVFLMVRWNELYLYFGQRRTKTIQKPIAQWSLSCPVSPSRLQFISNCRTEHGNWFRRPSSGGGSLN